LYLGYNKNFDTYNGIEMNVYNDKGVSIKKYRKNDMYDGSAAHGEMLVTDERYLLIKHTVATYPLTIEKEYEEDRNSFIDLGQWYTQLTGQAIQHSVIKVIAEPSIGFRYSMLNSDIKPVKQSVKGLDEYIWEFRNLPVRKNTSNTLPWKTLPDIEMAVNTFNCYGYQGDFNSWQSFSKWFQSLNNDVGALSPQRVAEIRKMTDSIKTSQGKVRFLYHYLQQSVRYVDIDLGIGGYRAYPATFVDEKKYGDCKALSNYMRALLKAVNIDANYVIIGAGDKAQPVDPGFPANRFNHVILCVPFKNDTTWLECTSQKQAYGKLGTFTENRKALLIDQDGGRLVNTPSSTTADNQFNSEVSIKLNGDGSAKSNIKVLTTGAYRAHYLAYNTLSIDLQKQFFTRLLHMRQFSELNITHTDSDNATNETNLDVTFDKFCDIISDDKLFLRPFAFDLSTYVFPPDANRKTDLHFEYPMAKSCITTIMLPEGFEIETLPPNATFKFEFGTYEINYVYDQSKNNVVSTVKFNLNNAVIPAGYYTEMQRFFDDIGREQRRKLVIRRKH